MTINLYQYGTGKRLAIINKKDLNAWCDAYGYLVHHAIKHRGYVVIAK